MLSVISSLIGGLFGLGSQYFNNKKEEAQAKHEQKIAILKDRSSWDQIQAQNSGNSWKDEYLTIILTAPFVIMFTAAAFGNMEVVDRIDFAFKTISERIPKEYWLLLGVVVSASFGVKKVTDIMAKWRGVK